MAIISMRAQLKVLVRRLKQKIFGKDSIRAWYEVFLTLFVLLGTLEQCYQSQMNYLHANSKNVSTPPHNFRAWEG